MNAEPNEVAAGTRELSYAEALYEAMDIALSEDERVVLMGEDIGIFAHEDHALVF